MIYRQRKKRSGDYPTLTSGCHGYLLLLFFLDDINSNDITFAISVSGFRLSMTWVVLEVDQNQDLYHPERFRQSKRNGLAVLPSF
jgi:hypothetical protein